MAQTDRGLNLREWRERRGLTQDELAGRLRMSRSTIQDLEAGRSNGTRRTWSTIAEELDTSVEALLAPRAGPQAESVTTQ